MFEFDDFRLNKSSRLEDVNINRTVPRGSDVLYSGQANTDPYDSDEVPLCSQTFADANGVSLPLLTDCLAKILARSRRVFSHSIQVSTSQPGTKLQKWRGHTPLGAGRPLETTVSIIYWYSTGGQDYWHSLSLGYDVCAVFLGGAAMLNTFYWRAPNDTGSYVSAFDHDCVEATEQLSEDLAM